MMKRVTVDFRQLANQGMVEVSKGHQEEWYRGHSVSLRVAQGAFFIAKNQ